MIAKSIVIGSNGYLGRHMADRLSAMGFENSNYDIHSAPSPGVENYKPLDLTDREQFCRLDPGVDYLFLFAGLTGTAEGFDRYHEFVNVNEIGLLNLLDWVRQTGCRARIVFPSTRLVYRGSNRPLREADPCEAKTIYAAGKLNAEKLLQVYHNAFGIEYTVFRICVPYGSVLDGPRSYGTLGFFLRQAESGRDISLFGDGQIRRTFTHVSDICSSIMRAVVCDGSRNEIVNIGGEDLSLLKVAEQVADKYGVSVQFVGWPEMALKLESGSTVFCDSKLQSLVPCRYEFSIKSWLEGLPVVSPK